MATRPSDLPTWATGAGAELSTPPTASQSNGWVAGLKPPHEWFNWWMNLVYQWLSYFDDTVSIWDDLAEAAAELSVGDSGVVFEDDNDVGPGTTTESKNTAVASATQLVCDIRSDGRRVFIAQGDVDPKAYARTLAGAQSGGSPVVTYTRTNTGSVSKILSNGTTVVVAYGVYVEAFNWSTGASLWVFTCGISSVLDIAMFGNRVYVVSSLTNGTGNSVNNRHVHALNKTTGAVVASYQHSAAGSVSNVCTNGRQVFISGAASTYASACTTRALRASDLADYDGEGNGGAAPVDDDGLAWNRVDAVVVASQCIDCDGRFVYMGYGSAAANQLVVLGQADGDVAWTYADPDASMSTLAVCVDQDYAYIAVDDGSGEGFVKAFDKATGTLIWKWGDNSLGPAHCSVVALCSDGQALFAIAKTETYVLKVSRGNVPMRVRKVDQSTELIRYGNWILQPEAQ